jgi:hypothetical protein
MRSLAGIFEQKAPGHALEEVFSYRQAYVGSMIGGATGPEYTKDRKQAAETEVEIDILWRKIRKHALAAVGHGKYENKKVGT